MISPGLRRLETDVGYLMNVLTDSFPVASFYRTTIVPSVLSGILLRKATPTAVTEQIPILTVVLMKVEFEFRIECPLAIPTCVWHIIYIPRSLLKFHRNVHCWRFHREPHSQGRKLDPRAECVPELNPRRGRHRSRIRSSTELYANCFDNIGLMARQVRPRRKNTTTAGRTVRPAYRPADRNPSQ